MALTCEATDTIPGAVLMVILPQDSGTQCFISTHVISRRTLYDFIFCICRVYVMYNEQQKGSTDHLISGTFMACLTVLLKLVLSYHRPNAQMADKAKTNKRINFEIVLLLNFETWCGNSLPSVTVACTKWTCLG